MKLKFRGWSREVYPHSHDVAPIKGGPSRRHPLGKPGEPLQWDSAFHARGRVNGLALSGDFVVEFEFGAEELRSWLSAYAKECPEEALRLLGEMQAEATINLIASAQEAK